MKLCQAQLNLQRTFIDREQIFTVFCQLEKGHKGVHQADWDGWENDPYNKDQITRMRWGERDRWKVFKENEVCDRRRHLRKMSRIEGQETILKLNDIKKDMITTTDLARVLGVKSYTIRAYIRDGFLYPDDIVLGRYKFKKESIKEWIRKNADSIK